MGIIRVILALSVVLAHSPWRGLGVGGQYAVQLFYMISGFLISYILDNTPAYQSRLTFYASRALRIYPVYYAVGFLTLVVAIIAARAGHPHPVETTFQAVPLLAKVVLTGANALLFGQDWIHFTAVQHNHLVLSSNFNASDIPVWAGLLDPPAWTLGVELTFYVLAPIILASNRLIVAVLALSVVLRLVFFIVAPHLASSDPWTYRFFPFEIAFFLLGALSQRMVLPIWQARHDRKIRSRQGLLLFGAFCVLFPLLPGDILKVVVLFLSFIAAMPLLFIYQNNNWFDKIIGDLSYPIYMGQWLVIYLIKQFSVEFKVHNDLIITASNALAAVVFAIVLNGLVAHPVERIRKRLRAGGGDALHRAPPDAISAASP